jgi:predicted CoA-binding protein
MSNPIFDELEAGLDKLLREVSALGGLLEVESLLRRARRELILASAVTRPSVAVVGASADRSKYGNKAVRAFRKAGFDVYPINPNAGRVEGLRSYPSLDALPLSRLDRVSVYLPPSIGLTVLDQVAAKEVGELWLNPGADAPEVVARAEALGLNVVQACSIVGVGEHPDDV